MNEINSGTAPLAEHATTYPTVNLDRVTPAKPRDPCWRKRRQCAYCFINRSKVFFAEFNGCEDRALQALRDAHPEEYDELLQRERNTAEEAAMQAWDLHLEGKCKTRRGAQ